jgi:putative ABC transport system permease protein
MEDGIRTSIESLGDNVVYIQKWPWEFTADYPWWKYINRPVPNLRELDQLKKRSDKIDVAAFIASTRQNIQVRDNQIERATIMCASHDYGQIWAFDIQEGRYFSSFESAQGKNQAVIGADIANNLFPGMNAVGRTFKLKGNKIKVVGVFVKEGNTIGQSLDQVVLLPVNYARNIFDLKSERMDPMIMVKAKDGLPIEAFLDHLTGLLRSIRKLKPVADDNFALNRASIILKQFNTMFGVVNAAGWVIGGLSILVGAFGIANIMFVSVRERTNQIGIQKALGAKNYFILAQFLIESVVLAVLGGIIGLILVGIAVPIVNSNDIMEVSLTLSNIARGINISVVVGLLSGFIPAYRASRLNPVEAIQATV